MMRRTILKWLAGVCLTLILLLVLALGGVGFIAGTPAGLKFVLKHAKGGIPGELSIGEIEGGLLGHLVLKDVIYRDSALAVGVDLLCLDWVPDALFKKVFHIKLLQIDGVRYEQLKAGEKAPDEKQAGSLELPDITLPVAIRLDDVQVNGVKVIQKNSDKPLEISRFFLSAGFDTQGLDLSTFEFLMPGVSLRIDGKLAPRGVYPLDFNTSWKFQPRGEPAINLVGEGGISGDLKRLTLRQNISGDVAAELLVHAADVLGELHWDAGVKVSRVAQGLLASVEAVPELKNIRPTLNLDAKGDLKHAQASLGIEIVSENNSKIADNASLKTDDTTADDAQKPLSSVAGAPEVAQVTLDGNVIFDTLKFAASGNWSGLKWPLAGPPLVVSESGEFGASGMPDKYIFTLKTTARGRDIPEMDIEVDGNGTSESVKLDKLHVELLDGSLDVEAEASWKPQVSWNALVSASNINPGVMAQDFPGSLSLKIDTKGKIEKDCPVLELNIDSFGGTLRDKEVSGEGQILMSGGQVTVNGLDLLFGGAELDVKGSAGSKGLDLAWNANVPDLSGLLPDGGGNIKISGQLSGTPSRPAVAGFARIRDFSYAASSCSMLDANFSLSLDEKTNSSLKLRASGLESGGQEISELSADLNGSLSDHEICVSAVHEAVTFTLKAEHGKFDQQKKAWSGMLSALGFDTADFGNWSLARSVNLELSPEEAQVPRLCLQDGTASVCANAHWLKKGDGTARAEIRGISFKRFSQFLPPSVTELSGEINADLHAGLGAVPTADAKIAISPGVVECLVAKNRKVRLEYQGGSIDASIDKKEVSANVNLQMGDNGIDASVNIPRAMLEEDIKRAPLDGNVNVEVRALGLVSAFVPEIQDTEGSLTARLNIGGVVGDPRINGKAMLEMAGPDVPMAGLDIDETLFDVVADSATGLKITGHVKSGQDSLNVKGNVLLDAAKGWPAHVELTGNNFMILNIPDATVRISPALNINYAGKDGVKVRGEVTVPEAEITPRQIPAGVEKPSGDVVIVSKDNPQGKKGMPIDAEVTLNLLDLVHFQGFGLDCHITGSVTVVVLPGKEPVAHGELKIKDGTFRFYGHDLTIEKGIISYAGGRLDNPGVNLIAVRDVQDTPVGVRVTGYVTDLDVSGYSTDPSISSQDAITMLITGKTKNDPGFSEAAANTAVIAGADLMAQQLKNYTGLDHLDVKGAGENSSETRVFAGKDVTEDLTVGVEAGTDDDGTMFVARYHLWKGLDLEMKSGAAKSGAGLVYTITFK